MKIVACTDKDAIAGLEVQLVGNADLLVADRVVEALALEAARKVERLAPAVLVEVRHWGG